MAETIETVRRRLRQEFLGKAGIHGLGASRAEQAIRVYVDPDAPADLESVLERVRQSASPFSVSVVQEERPDATGGPAAGE
jgi:hypothetical protein